MSRQHFVKYTETGATVLREPDASNWDYTATMLKRRLKYWALADWFAYGRQLGISLSPYAQQMAWLAEHFPQPARNFPQSYDVLLNLTQLGLSVKETYAQVQYMQRMKLDESGYLLCSRVRLWLDPSLFSTPPLFDPHVRRRNDLPYVARRTLRMLEGLDTQHALYVGDYCVRYGWAQRKPDAVPCALLTRVHDDQHYIVGIMVKTPYFPMQYVAHWLLSNDITHDHFKRSERMPHTMEIHLPPQLSIPPARMVLIANS
jgi:hypothetical protein